MINNIKGARISFLAMFIALSAVGAFIKVPAIVGSVALDSFPALLAAAVLGGGSGAVVAGVGHLLSSIMSGMPLGAFHAIIAVEMACLVWIFGLFNRTGKHVLAGVFFIVGNAFVAPLPFMFLMDRSFYIALLPSLLAGSIINIVISFLLIPRSMNLLNRIYKGVVKQ